MTRSYDLEVIEEQFGPIIRGIVQDRLLLERLSEPPSAESYRIIRQVRRMRLPLVLLIDLDCHRGNGIEGGSANVRSVCEAPAESLSALNKWASMGTSKHPYSLVCLRALGLSL